MLRLGIYQGGNRDGVENNIHLLEEVISSNEKQSIDLFVFCELFLSGYCIGDEFSKVAVEVQSPVIQKIQDIAKKYKVGISFGYPERDGTKIYNSAILIDKEGKILINYRKTHVWLDYENKYFEKGDKLSPVVEFEGLKRKNQVTNKGWKVALLICYDVEFPETSRCLALQGAEFLIVPTALCGVFNANITVPSRAFENQIFMCYVNRVGEESCPALHRSLTFSGLSVIVAPDGTELARANESEHKLFVAELKKDGYEESKHWNPYFKDRRPDLYQLIASKQNQ